MLISNSNNVKILNLTSGNSFPKWSKSKNKRKLFYDHRCTQLIQDFDMPTISSKVIASKDGYYLAATGTYKPRVKCYEVEQLSLKFERCLESECISFLMLEDNYEKMVFLQQNRKVEFHSKGGVHFQMRIPKFGRDLAYHRSNCTLYFACEGPNIFRINLEQGRFLSSWPSDSTSTNAICINPEHNLLAFGTSRGFVESWDPRLKKKIGILDCQLPNKVYYKKSSEITALSFRDGLNLGVGLSNGNILLFDLRSNKPYIVKDHLYDLPIKKILFHKSQDKVISLDSKSAKIWDRLTSKTYASIESECELNDVSIIPDSGLIFMANEQPKLQVHFIPTLGPAPKWCSFLDRFTEEMEDVFLNEVYEDYKFLTKDQVNNFGLEHLIGTSLMRAYMHGFFINAKLYEKININYLYDSDIKQEEDVIQAFEDERQKRVVLKKKCQPMVNKKMFSCLNERRDLCMCSKNLLTDNRFNALFNDHRFNIDQDESVFKLISPVMSRLKTNK